MSQDDTIRIGVVGVGGIAQHQHIPGYLRCPNVEITALCDINDDLLRPAGEHFGVERLFTDYRELVALEELDAVDICTSNDMHHPVAMAAIAEGKHVFCEKPLALNYTQAREMYEAAKKAGVKTGVGFTHRLTPASRYAQRLVSSGALGDIYHVIAIYSSGAANFAERPIRWRNIRAKSGTGVLCDLGSHMIDMMRWWMGEEITSVAAQTRTFVKKRRVAATGEILEVDVDDASCFLADFEGEAMGTFINSRVFTAKGFDQRVEIYGYNGALLYDQRKPYELELCIGREMRELFALPWGIEKKQFYATVPVPRELRDKCTPDNPPRLTLSPDFVGALRGEAEMEPTFHEGMKVQEVVDAVWISAQERRWVDLPLPG